VGRGDFTARAFCQDGFSPSMLAHRAAGGESSTLSRLTILTGANHPDGVVVWPDDLRRGKQWPRKAAGSHTIRHAPFVYSIITFSL
jgi:hypothetical protein